LSCRQTIPLRLPTPLRSSQAMRSSGREWAERRANAFLAGYTIRAVREAYRQIYLRLPVPNFSASQARMQAWRCQ